MKVLENAEDSELGLFESETVTMAMGLLTAVMSGAADVSGVVVSSEILLPMGWHVMFD